LCKKDEKKSEEAEHSFDLSATLLPDLNPIEQIWKAIKRELSPLSIKTSNELKEVISSSFYELTQRISFAEKWIEKFLNFG